MTYLRLDARWWDRGRRGEKIQFDFVFVNVKGNTIGLLSQLKAKKGAVSLPYDLEIIPFFPKIYLYRMVSCQESGVITSLSDVGVRLENITYALATI